MTVIKYSVEITGHVAPFKWLVRNPTHTGMGTGSKNGTADTYEDALFQASEAAHQMEHDRVHRTTVRNESLFEVDTDETKQEPCDFDCERRGGPHGCMCP